MRILYRSRFAIDPERNCEGMEEIKFLTRWDLETVLRIDLDRSLANFALNNFRGADEIAFPSIR
ncbi:MAG: hypothetical protein AAGC68_06665 [Verrucomicrobiota bacterium]